MTDLERLLLEAIPTGRFGNPRPVPRPAHPPDAPDPDAAAHRRALAAAIRAAA